MYKIQLNDYELELVLSALRYTTENGYDYVDLESDNKDSYWKESVEEYHSMYRVYDKLIEERNKV